MRDTLNYDTIGYKTTVGHMITQTEEVANIPGFLK